MSLLNKIFSVVQELYIYGHLKNYETDTEEDIRQDVAVAGSVMSILIFIFSFTMIKMLAIFIYFFIVNLMINFGRFFMDLFRRKCNINFLTEIKFGCYNLVKILKKMYTYNFYSYENKILGFCLVTLYMIFIIFNIIFAIDFMNTDDQFEEIPDSVKIIQIIAFEMSIIIELLCCSFYITRCIKQQFIIMGSSFLFLNFVVTCAVFYKSNYCEEETSETPRRIANIIFIFYFSIMFVISLIKVCRYDLNCKVIIHFYFILVEAWKCLLKEKQKFYSDKDNLVACMIICDENSKICEISSKIKLRNVYKDSESPFFFKKKDRFYHRKKIIALLVCIFLMNLTELFYTIFRLFNTDPSQIHTFRVVQKFFSCFHMIFLLLLSWFAFLKLEIRTVTLY